ncbi:MAG TPA: hypothetical protein VK429_08585 [Patescibacteria group bacterium]|nr:hypothetical protein [Patescibacteria group bacterium]
MRGPHFRFTIKSVVAILCAACFLAMNLGSVSRAVADDAWEAWPKKTAEPVIELKPATDANEAAKAGDTAGKKTATGSSYKTIGWIALGIAAVIGIAIAAGGGGGGDGGSTVMNPGHQ